MNTIVKIKNKTIYEFGKILNNMYEFRIRKKLKNDNFSIICSNCIGGIIYHRLGKKFLSPTINLWLHQDDYVNFVLYLDYYIKQELEFISSEYDYPVGKLRGDIEKSIPDIRIYFNHDKKTDEAEKKWKERRERINFDNLYLIMYLRNDVSVELVKQLDNVKCRNKIILTMEECPEIDWSLKITPHKDRLNGEQCLDKDIFGFCTFEKEFDFVSFLNT